MGGIRGFGGARWTGLFALVIGSFLALMVVSACGTSGEGKVEKANSPKVEKAPEPTKDPAKEQGAKKGTAEADTQKDQAEKKDDKAKQDGAGKKDEPEEEQTDKEQAKAAEEERETVPDEASAAASASASASAAASEGASEGASERTTSERASASASAPADTTMNLSVPAIGLDVPVYEGTSEASLSAGTGHLTGTGYPWIPGSNTYIAGHRIGYPGTASDYVFWDLPNLAIGDEVYLTDANGTSYTYAVSEILEVPITDLSVTAPVGRDVVSLQTCIENYGDYWTPGPNWNVRYVVRADKVA